MRRRSIPLGLSLLALALGLAQRPRTVVADPKVDLFVDPARFLGHVLSVWSPTSDLGHVFGAQYSGYAFPMAPFFAVGDAVGLPVWLVHRLWLAALLAAAAYGVVRLLDALGPDGPRRGVLHAAAGALYVVNPYVTVDADRTSIALLSYAALPWLLLAVHRGLRAPRSWWWPAAFALVLTSTGGGVNVGTTGWLLLGPLLLGVYELVWGGVGRAAVAPFALRMVAVNAVAQAWWVIPVLIQARAAPSFLAFSEQPGTIWSTTSLAESLRLMGFWTSYVGVGYGGVLRPFATHGNAMLFLAPVVLASLLVPALALASFGWTRRWRYAPFFLALTLAGLFVMAVGFPDGTPLRRGVTFAYYRVESIQFLRTTYKAGPLVALGLACLGGAGFGALWTRLPRARRVDGGARGLRRPVDAARRRAAGDRGRRRRRARRPRRVAARQRPRPGGAARVLRAAVLARRRPRPRPPRRRQPRAGAAGPALRVLPLGRDDRRDPARADEAPRRDALDRAVLRPPGDRPAVDGRRPHRRGAPALGAARSAPRPARRRRPRGRGRRR